MSVIEPFKISVDQAVLDDLAYRLGRVDYPHDYANDDWSYGVNATYLKSLVDYWKSGYDWREQEKRINSFDHFRTIIEDVPIHFIRQKGVGPNPVPLILSHGWPWTFWDLKDVIRPLADPAAFGGDPADAFDVIVPSLPGFGFSTPLTRTGINFTTTADLWAKLMTSLGYATFAAQGGDWGSMVTMQLAHKYPERVRGIHTTMVVPLDLFANERPWDVTRGVFVPADLSPEDREKRLAWQRRIASHVAVHVLDPQTLSYALHDSPVGLLAWLIERRRAWGDCRDGLEARFDRDFLLTTTMIFWITKSFVTSARFYAEVARHPWSPSHPGSTVTVPTGISHMLGDGTVGFASEGKDLYSNIVFSKKNEDGGHFGPSEAPEAIIDDIRATFRHIR